MAARRSDGDDVRMRRRYTHEQRSELVDQVTGGRATVPEAAARLEVPHSTAYKWIRQATAPRDSARKAKRAATPGRSVSTPSFMQVVRAGDASATIAVQIGGAEIAVRRGFDAEILRSVVEALRGGVA
jgi:transposase-like protein